MKKTPIDSETKQAVDAFIKKTATYYSVIGAILFGSRARHTHRPDSDADVVVLLAGKPENFIETNPK